MKFSTKKVAGFTMVEIMVVITVIAILSAIVYANFGQGRAVARENIRKTDLQNLQVAIELYKKQYGHYPDGGCNMRTNNQAWVAPGAFSTGATYDGGITSGTQQNCPEYIVGLVPEFIAKLPVDPSFNGADQYGYRYAVNQAGTEYKLISSRGIETDTIMTADSEFSRCPVSCTAVQGWCGSAASLTDPGFTKTYSVHSAGAVCW